MPRPPLPAARLLALALILCPAESPADEQALALITREGGTIAFGDLAPALIELTADSAFPLLKDAKGGPVAAAGEALDGTGGRVVAFAHDGFLRAPAMIGQEANVHLVGNAIRWAGRATSPKIALHPDLKGLAAALAAGGLDTTTAAPAELDAAAPPAVYVIVAQRGLDGEAITKLLDLSSRGMGLVIAATSWAFANDHANFADFPANRLAAPAGLRLRPDGYADRSRPLAVTYADSRSILDAAAELARDAGKVEPARRDALIASLREGGSLRGEALTQFLTSLQTLSRKVGPIVPTKEKPLVPGADPLVDAVVLLEDELNQTLPAGRMYPIAAASDYPGAVTADAARGTQPLSIDGTWRGWLSGRGSGFWAAKEMRPTGLYAAPGEVITVTAPAAIAGQGFEVVIGAYGGGLSGRDQWHRYPRLQRAVEIQGPETRISNALGGLITIRVPKGATHGALDFTVAGAIAAPLYVEGRTDPREWRDRIRRHPAPWAELASERIIIAIPSSYIRRLDDPGELMGVWDAIIEKAAELCGGVDRDRYRAERIVFDRQTAAGSMHSGYPVAAHQDRSAERAVDARALKAEGDWGFFHEYGHNHQHDLWGLPGTGETTCNLWSVYLYEEFIGLKREEGHDAIRPLDRRQRMNAYFQNGRKFDAEWSMWVALEAYLQVQEAFGWEPYKKVFAEYNALPESEWPRTQQEKNDQWVIRLSKACGKNLAPFWAAWNVPLSPAVHEALADLPAWTDHPVAGLAK
jgi:hypothetical protein